MSDDLVGRLRDCPDMDAVDEAADALEDQAARIAELEAALRGLLEWAGPIAGDTRVESERVFEEETVRIANAALEGGKKE